MNRNRPDHGIVRSKGLRKAAQRKRIVKEVFRIVACFRYGSAEEGLARLKMATWMIERIVDLNEA